MANIIYFIRCYINNLFNILIMSKLKIQSAYIPKKRKTNQYNFLDFIKAQRKILKYGTHHKINQ